ncbi:Uncharacterised protein at_DN0156 [Pycnogonum litorale]
MDTRAISKSTRWGKKSKRYPSPGTCGIGFFNPSSRNDFCKDAPCWMDGFQKTAVPPGYRTRVSRFCSQAWELFESFEINISGRIWWPIRVLMHHEPKHPGSIPGGTAPTLNRRSHRNL